MSTGKTVFIFSLISLISDIEQQEWQRQNVYQNFSKQRNVEHKRFILLWLPLDWPKYVKHESVVKEREQERRKDKGHQDQGSQDRKHGVSIPNFTNFVI